MCKIISESIILSLKYSSQPFLLIDKAITYFLQMRETYLHGQDKLCYWIMMRKQKSFFITVTVT